MLFIAFFPDVVERSGHSEKATGLTDAAAQAWPSLPRLDLFINSILHPDPPAVDSENIPPVRDAY